MVGEAFRVDAVLGRGAMGVVYAATDLALDRRVALKLHRYVDEAEAELLQALAILEPSVGPEHSIVATVRVDLGEVHHAQGRFADAKREYELALAGC